MIARARARALEGYRERHHVLPRCMGGTNDPANIVDLTPEEHYVAHQLLVKMYPGVPGLAWAAVKMAKRCSGNKAYGWLKRRHAIATAAARKGKQATAETRAKMSAIRKGKKCGPMSEETRIKIGAAKTGRPLSSEHRARISEAQRGKAKAPEHVAKMAASRRGKRHSPEAIAKMSAAKRGKKMPAGFGARLSVRLIGNTHTLGFKHSSETRAKMSAARKGQHLGNKFALGFKQSEATKAERAAAHRGQKRSEQARANMAVAQQARWANGMRLTVHE